MGYGKAVTGYFWSLLYPSSNSSRNILWRTPHLQLAINLREARTAAMNECGTQTLAGFGR